MAKKRKIFRKLLFFTAALLTAAGYFFPDTLFYAKYYCYEAYDHAAERLGIAPHYDNLDLGTPQGQKEKTTRIFNREGYAFGYAEAYEQPLWVTYKLTVDELKSKRYSRTDDFREDPRVLTRTAKPEDYKNSGYDRGHLAPAADMGWSAKVMSESFYMSNMSPQHPGLNRGIWLTLEEKTRDIARKESEIFIVCGPYFDEDEEDIRRLGKTRLAVPEGFYKVILDLTPPRKMIGFLFPNKKCGGNLTDYAVTVEDVEDKTGLRFFPELLDAEKMKETISVSAWGL